MGGKIKKLNQLKNTESFLQANTIKGFRYIDKAGELVNSYYKKDVAPLFNMSLDGLVIEKPIDKVEQLKITPISVWMRFIEIDSLDNISRIYSKELQEVCDILSIGKMNRLGWRNYFIHEFTDPKQEETVLKNLKILDQTKTEFIRIKIETTRSFEALLMLQILVKPDRPENKALLFDIDLFQRGELGIDKAGNVLNNFREYLQDKEGFLGMVNKILR